MFEEITTADILLGIGVAIGGVALTFLQFRFARHSHKLRSYVPRLWMYLPTFAIACQVAVAAVSTTFQMTIEHATGIPAFVSTSLPMLAITLLAVYVSKHKVDACSRAYYDRKYEAAAAKADTDAIIQVPSNHDGDAA